MPTIPPRASKCAFTVVGRIVTDFKPPRTIDPPIRHSTAALPTTAQRTMHARLQRSDGLSESSNRLSNIPRCVYHPICRATERGVAILCFVTALVALIPTAASLPDLRSTPPPCDCEGAVLLERIRLQAEHSRLMQALEKAHESQITQLEGLVAALGGDSNTPARDLVLGLALLPRAPLLAPNTPKEPAGGVRTMGAGTGLGELRKSAPSRALLQTEKFCSMDELMSVQKDAAAAVTGMLTTNAGCAMCLIPCASAENALSCAVGCVKQVPFQELHDQSSTDMAHHAHKISQLTTQNSTAHGMRPRSLAKAILEACKWYEGR
jgi:hypothetical protein